MRYRVDLRYGYASYDASDADKAKALYDLEGIRLRECRDIHDDGVIIMGAPDFSGTWIGD